MIPIQFQIFIFTCGILFIFFPLDSNVSIYVGIPLTLIGIGFISRIFAGLIFVIGENIYEELK